jgi:hypothetical protein
MYLYDGVTSTYVNFQYSQDEGQTWNVLGTSNDSDWYVSGTAWTGKTDDWKLMKHSLKNTGENLQFRYKFWAIEPKTGFAIDNFEICDGPVADFNFKADAGTVTFTDTSINANNYYWSFSDGQSSNLQNPVMNFDLDTIVATLYVSNDCVSDSVSKTIYTVGIKDIITSKIKIYPNPAHNFIRIETGDLNGEIVVEIIDVESKVLITKEISLIKNNDNIFMDLSYIDKGIYFVKVKTKDGIIIKKLVKQ